MTNLSPTTVPMPRDSPFVYVAASFSLVGAISVVVSVLKYQAIIAPRHKILGVSAMFDAIFAGTALIGRSVANIGPLCAITGVLIGWGLLSSLVLTTALAFHTYMLLVLGKPILECVKYFRLYGLLIFISFVEKVTAAGLGRMELSGPWCWIGMDFPILRLLDLYAFAWLFMLIGFCLTVLLGRRYYRLSGHRVKNEEANEWAQLHLHVIKTTVLYQLVEFVVYIFATVHRAAQIHGSSTEGLQFLHDVALSSLGILTAIVYFYFDSPKRNRRRIWSLRRVLTISETFKLFVQFSERKGSHVQALHLWKALWDFDQYRWNGDPIFVKDLRQLYPLVAKCFGQDVVTEKFRRRITEFIDDHKADIDNKVLTIEDVEFVFDSLEDVQDFIHKKLYWKFLDSPEWEIFYSSQRFQNEVLAVYEESLYIVPTGN